MLYGHHITNRRLQLLYGVAFPCPCTFEGLQYSATVESLPSLPVLIPRFEVDRSMRRLAEFKPAPIDEYDGCAIDRSLYRCTINYSYLPRGHAMCALFSVSCHETARQSDRQPQCRILGHVGSRHTRPRYVPRIKFPFGSSNTYVFFNHTHTTNEGSLLNCYQSLRFRSRSAFERSAGVTELSSTRSSFLHTHHTLQSFPLEVLLSYRSHNTLRRYFRDAIMPSAAAADRRRLLLGLVGVPSRTFDAPPPSLVYTYVRSLHSLSSRSVGPTATYHTRRRQFSLSVCASFPGGNNRPSGPPVPSDSSPN